MERKANTHRTASTDPGKAKNRQATIRRGNKVADKTSPEPAKTPDPFDIKTVEAFIALMVEHELSEIDLRKDQQRIRLRRGPAATEVMATPAFMPAPAVPPATPAAVPAAPVAGSTASRGAAQTDAAPSPAKQLVEIKSPTPGTFYAAASPDAQPFVRVGSKVTPSSVVCLIEAMKIFNEITADCTGAVAEILVENQQAVEYGQVLFRVDPAA